MKKGLLFAGAMLGCFAFVAYGASSKEGRGVKETVESVAKDYSVVPKALPSIGTIITTAGYTDAWRALSMPGAKSVIVGSDGQNIAVGCGKKGTGATASLIFAYSNDAGSSWDTRVIAPNMNIRIYNGLALDADENPYIVWQDRAKWSIQWAKDEGGIGGGAWTNYDTLAGDSACWYMPTLALNGSGKMIMSAYAHYLADPGSDYSTHAVISNDLGASWMAPFDRHALPGGWNRLMTNTYYGPNGFMDDTDWLISSSGDTIIGVSDIITNEATAIASNDGTGAWSGFELCINISYDGGATWNGIQLFDSLPQYNHGTWWYRYDGSWIDGVPHIVMSSWGNIYNAAALFHAKPTVDGDYSHWTIQRISDVPIDYTPWNGFNADWPSISSDDAGNIFVTYRDGNPSISNPAYEIYGVASTDGGATWLTPVQLTNEQGELDGDLYLETAEHVLADNKIHMIFLDPAATNNYYWSVSTAPLLAASARPHWKTLTPELLNSNDSASFWWEPPDWADQILFPGVGSPVGDGTVDVISLDTLYFYCSSVNGNPGAKYEITISKTSDWTGTDIYRYSYFDNNGPVRRSPICIQYDLPGVIGLPSTGVWYWKARAYAGADTGQWSVVNDFNYTGTAINTTDWVATGVAGNPVGVSHPFVLSQSRPNPARDNAAISFSLPKAGAYSLKVYNVAGQVVRTVNGTGAAGMNTVNINSRSLSNGVYFYQLTANNNTATKKMVVLK